MLQAVSGESVGISPVCQGGPALVRNLCTDILGIGVYIQVLSRRTSACQNSVAERWGGGIGVNIQVLPGRTSVCHNSL